MGIIINDPQLSSEMQELYILSKNYLSILEFYNDELRIFNNLIASTMQRPEVGGKVLKRQEILDKLLQLDKNCEDTKEKINNHLKSLEMMVVHSPKYISFQLVEQHLSIKNEMDGLLQSFKILKECLFTKEPIKTKS
jgi:hypothetical protein